MAPDPETPLQVRSTGGVVELVLDDPARRNAMTAAMTAAWSDAVASLRVDPDVRCVLVRATGSAFCAGGDVRWVGADAGAGVAALRERMLGFYRTWLSLRDLEVPLVAAVQGPAVGAGAVLALMADVRLVSPSARFSVPFTRLGMHPGMGAVHLLREVAGVAVARDLLLTGRTVDGEEMLRLGLATALHPDEELAEQAAVTAAAVAGSAPVAARLTTVALRGPGHADLSSALQWEALAQAVTLETEDLAEGLAARAERRPPRFSGR